MKKDITPVLFITIVMYIAEAVTAASFNIADWGEQTRLYLPPIWVIMLVSYFGFVYLDRGNK